MEAQLTLGTAIRQSHDVERLHQWFEVDLPGLERIGLYFHYKYKTALREVLLTLALVCAKRTGGFWDFQAHEPGLAQIS